MGCTQARVIDTGADLVAYKHIIWDWNGTLLDDAWLSVEITGQMLQRRGLPQLTQQRYQEVFGFPLQEYCARLGFDFEAESFDALSGEFMRSYETRRLECSLQPDAVAVLQAINRAGLEQSLLSAYRHRTLLELISHFRLEDFFVAAIGVDNDHGEGKIGNGRRWQEKLSFPRSQITLIGDTLHDLEVSEAMGVDCILLAGGHQSRSRLEASSARVVGELTEVLELLEKKL